MQAAVSLRILGTLLVLACTAALGASASESGEGTKPRLAGPAPDPPPFSWSQRFVIREGSSVSIGIQSFDPGGNLPRVVRPLPTVFEDFTLDPFNFDFGSNVTVLNWEKTINLLQVAVPFGAVPFGSPNFEDSQAFKVHVSGVSDEVITNRVIIDARPVTDPEKLEPRPAMLRSGGFIVRPGDIVRYRWSRRTGWKTPEWQFELTGKTLTAATLGADQEQLTDSSVKIRPVLLGHYLAQVRPWNSTRDAFSQQRGSDSNAAVFLCAFGSENLAPVADNLSADGFTVNEDKFPALGGTVTGITPVATDPETGSTVGAGLTPSSINFGDGTGDLAMGGTSIDHTFNEAGIFRAVCTIPDIASTDPVLAAGPDGTADDIFVVGATEVNAKGKGSTDPSVTFKARKEVVFDEGGEGVVDKDTLTMVWKGTGYVPQPGDRIVCCFNRNRFGQMHTESGGDDIILGPKNTFKGVLSNALSATVAANTKQLKITIMQSNFDRTADPRLGGVQLKGDFPAQFVAVAIVPADYPSSGVLVFRMRDEDLLRVTVKGGKTTGFNFEPEITVTTKSLFVAP
ncbi:MAG: hypothetical protein L6R28_04770 [Planctomycetes bacterium]|nr:hypothetical protein [Planctomycetota bacterium]